MRKYVLNFHSVIAIIFHIYFQFLIFECYNLLINLAFEIIKHTARKKVISMLPYHLKFPEEISLITVILDSVWQ